MMTTPAWTRTTRFTTADIDWFALTGHDRNPLHLDDGFARKSPFGERLVHGALAALTMLGTLAPRGRRVRRVAFEFPQPIFTGVEYSITCDEPPDDNVTLVMADGTRIVARGTVAFAEAATERPELMSHAPFRPDTDARRSAEDDLAANRVEDIPYALSAEAYDDLDRRFGLHDRGFGPSAAMALVGASYVVGMRLPGERALFTRLQLRLEAALDVIELPAHFRCRIKTFDKRLNLLTTAVQFCSGERVLAEGDLMAFVRRPVHREIVVPSPGPAPLTDRVALVIGASRGLGASLAIALAARGAKVIANYQRSETEARNLVESYGHVPGSIELAQGDARTVEWCIKTRQDVTKRYGRLDFLICNAAPSLRPLWLEPNSHSRVMDYLSSSVQLAATPLMTFLRILDHSQGAAVLISSAAVRQPVAQWPHYVAAKCATEGLIRTAALEYPHANFLIVRPPQLLTDFAPHLSLAELALPPERVAAAVVSQLQAPRSDDHVEILEAF